MRRRSILPTPLALRAGLCRAPVVAVWIVLLAGCGGPGVEMEGDPALSAHPRISPTPPMAGEALVAVEVLDAGAPPPEATRVVVTPIPGRLGPGVPAVLVPGEPGWWSGEVTFPEAGPLRLEIVVTLPGGRSATFRYPVTVTRRPGG